ncbi:Uma2 family endonuclease [Streptomyces sp. NPDC002888]|uniref:Uma2 family endonuclease n=1 Tax=Streptomyces sp. NPDC002888 TaxID=3364668 RepID=UPI003686F54C
MPTPRPDRPLITWADWLMERNPGHRFEIIDGVLVVTPPPDAPHAEVLTDVMVAYLRAEMDGSKADVVQKVAVWLPTGPEDYAIPDLSVVDADINAHMVENNCYAPSCFRLVLEVTSENPDLDLRHKARAYAVAAIPVYVIVDRKDELLHILTSPLTDRYDSHQVYAAGQSVSLPDSIGAKVTLDVAEILKTGRPKTNG